MKRTIFLKRAGIGKRALGFALCVALCVALCFAALTGAAQAYTAYPHDAGTAMSQWPCPSSPVDGTCGYTYLGSVVKMRVSSIIDNYVTFEVQKCDGSNFLSGTQIYLKQSAAAASQAEAVCGDAILITANAGGQSSFSKTISANHSGRMNYAVTTVGSTDRYRSNLVAIDAAENANRAPSKPSNPNPPDGAVGVSTSPTFSWNSSDPEGGQVYYRLFMGETKNTLALEASGQGTSASGISFNLREGKTYYWSVDSYDSEDKTAISPTWSFTTAGQSGANPVVYLSSASVAFGEYLTVTGNGFTPNDRVQVYFTNGGQGYSEIVNADAGGTFTHKYFTMRIGGYPATITLEATDYGSGKMIAKTFNVTSPEGGGGGGGDPDCPFPNLPSTNGFHEAVCQLYSKGVLSGTVSASVTAAELEAAVTRKNVANIVFRGVYSIGGRSVPTAVPSDNYPLIYGDLSGSGLRAVKALLYLEYDNGISPFDRNRTLFQPDNSIARVHAIKVLLETFNIVPALGGASNPFAGDEDMDALMANDPLYFAYMRKACDMGIVTEGRPFADCKTGEIILMLYRIMSKVEAGNIADPNPGNADYFEPPNITVRNIASGMGIELGNFNHYARTSFSLDGVAPLDFTHTYNSYNAELPDEFFGMSAARQKTYRYQPLGPGWSHSYHSFVTLINASDGQNSDVRAAVHWGGGAIHLYSSNGTKFYPDSYGVYDDFDMSGGIVTITSKSGVEYRFRRNLSSAIADGTLKLWTVSDRNGNTLTVDYELGADDIDRIASVSDGIRSLTFNYKSGTNLISQISDPLGRRITFDYDASDYAGDGYILSGFGDAKQQETRYLYADPNSAKRSRLLSRIRLPKGNYIENEYDANRRLSKSTAYDANSVPTSRTAVTVAADYASSNKATNSTVQTYNGSSWQSYSYRFNENNNVTQITGSGNLKVEAAYNDITSNPSLPTSVSSNSGETDIQYDGRGNVIRVTRKSLTGTDTRTTQLDYNNDNTLRRVIDPRGNPVHYDYDGSGNLTRVSAPENSVTEFEVNGRGLVTKAINPEGIVTEYGYDAAGNPRSVSIPALGLTSAIERDAASRVTAATDFLNRRNSFVYDNNDNLTTERDAENRATSYVYDANDNTVSITGAKGGATTMTYDNATDLLASVSFGGFTKSYAYNDDGSLKTFTKPDGTTLNCTYDNLGRMTGDGVNTYSYDSNHRLEGIDRGRQRLAFEYDGFNRMAAVTCDDFSGNRVAYTYDANGNILSVTYPGNKTVVYAYDKLNRMKALTDWNGMSIAYDYFKDGRIRSVSYPGMNVTYDYDAAGRMTGKSAKHFDESVIVSYSFILDKAGNIISDNRAEAYSDGPWIASETVDYTYNAANRITKAGNTNFTFDSNGNTKTRGNATYAYDKSDKLVFGEGYNFEYDGLGNIRSDGSKRYVIDVTGAGSVIAETDMSGNPSAYYIYGADGLEARIRPDGTTEYYVSDCRGSVAAMVDISAAGREAGSVTHQYQYDEYGRVVRLRENDYNPFRYVGKYGVMYFSDNLYYMRARFYDASIGRFLSEDPVWSTNLYPYADNNPVMRIDPMGKFAWELILTPIDIGLGIWDVYQLQKAFRNNDSYGIVLNGFALTLDIVSISVPFLTGAGFAMKTILKSFTKKELQTLSKLYTKELSESLARLYGDNVGVRTATRTQLAEAIWKMSGKDSLFSFIFRSLVKKNISMVRSIIYGMKPIQEIYNSW